MNHKYARRAAAALIAVALTTGALPSFPVSEQLPLISAITAKADDDPNVYLSESTGELFLSGDCSALASEIREKASNARALSVISGAILPENCSALFAGNSSLETVDLSGADMSNVTDMSNMFVNCTKLKRITMNNLSLENVENASSLFAACFDLESVDLTGSDFANVKNMSSMFSQCNKLVSIKGLTISSTVLDDVYSMFSYCYQLTDLDLSKAHITTATKMSGMFSYCTALLSLDLSTVNTGNATSLASMFQYCSALCTLDLTHFDTQNVTDMNSMFQSCYALSSLKQNFNTSKVETMDSMFSYCKHLEELDLSNFTTTGGPDISYMFYESTGLKKLDISKFSSEEFTRSRRLFTGAKNLESLTLGPDFAGIESGMGLNNPTFGWANAANPSENVTEPNLNYSYSGTATFTNSGLNTYISNGFLGKITHARLEVLKDGTIGLRFYGRLSDRIPAEVLETAKVRYHLYHSEADDHYDATLEEDGTYSVLAPVSAKNMTESVEADFYLYADGTEYGIKEMHRAYFSVREYADVILSDPVKYEKEQDLIRSMLQYGGAAQRLFNHYGSETGTYYADRGIRTEYMQVPESDAFSEPAPLSGLSYYGTSLVLLSNTVQRHYFKLTSGNIGDYTFTVGDTPVEAQQYEDTNYYYIDCTGIPTAELWKSHQVTVASVNDPSQTMTFSYSILDYINRLKNTERATDADLNTAIALYGFSMYAAFYAMNTL